jgi:hypothetical protein
VRRLAQEPQRTILVVPPPAVPSARLVHTVRYYLDRYGLPIEALIETTVRALCQSQPEVLAGRLVRLPARDFLDGTPAQILTDREGLIQALAQAGAWVHLLPRLASWAVLTDQLAFLAVLERGVIVPPPAYDALADPQPLDTAPRRARRPEDNPHFVDPWLGKRSEWRGVPTAVRRAV